MRDKDRSLIRNLIIEYHGKKDFLGWFDQLYSKSGGDVDKIPWARLTPNVVLLEWLGRNGLRGDGRKALVVGCGLGDDAEELSRRGFKVTAFDISLSAVNWCKKRFPETAVDYQNHDLFKTPRSFRSGFDFVFESLTLQSLPATLRIKALETVSSFVSPGGRLLVITFGRDPSEDPGDIPWPLTHAELDRFLACGLTEVSFEELPVPDRPLHFLVEYRR